MNDVMFWWIVGIVFSVVVSTVVVLAAVMINRDVRVTPRAWHCDSNSRSSYCPRGGEVRPGGLGVRASGERVQAMATVTPTPSEKERGER